MGVNGLPAWVVSTFRKRIDVIGQRIQTHPKHQSEWKVVAASFERLTESMSEEQRKQFLEWEELMSFQVSKEREELYLRGFTDGFQVYACLDEWGGKICAEERCEETNPKK